MSMQQQSLSGNALSLTLTLWLRRITRQHGVAAQGILQHAIPGVSVGCAMLLVGRCTGLAEAASAVTPLVEARLEGCDPDTVGGA